MLRRMVLGLAGAVAVCGAVAAKPPGLQPNPHAEGREQDPVTRDYYLPEPPAVTSEPTGPAPLAAAGLDPFWAVVLQVHEAIINEFTMRLGTARTAGV